MLISERTIAILKNFGRINKHILIEPGSVLTTILPDGCMQACATIEETFPVELPIHDLPRVLSALGGLKVPVIKFNKEDFSIEETKEGETIKIFTFPYSERDLIQRPVSVRPEYGPSEISFRLPRVHLTAILDSCKKLGHARIEIRGTDGQLQLVSTPIAARGVKAASKSFSTTVCQTNDEFCFVFSYEHWKLMLPTVYQVNLSMDGIAHFMADGIEYWIAATDDSYIKQT